MRARRLTPDERRGYLFPYDSWANRIGVHRFVRDIPLEPDHPSRARLEAIARGLPAPGSAAEADRLGRARFLFRSAFSGSLAGAVSAR